MQIGNLATQKLPGLSLSQVKLPVPVLLYLLAVVTPIQFQLGTISLSPLRLLLLLLVVPLTIRLMMGKYGRLIWTDALFFLHILWAAVAMAANNPELVVEYIGSNSVEFIGAYVLGRVYIRDITTFIALGRALILLVIATLPLAIYEALTGNPIAIETIRNLPGLDSVSIAQNEPRLGLDRVQAVFAHPIHYGLFASVAFSLCFVGFKKIFSLPIRYLLSAIISLCVFFSLSSGALLALLLQMGLIFWAWVLRPLKYKWVLLILVIAFTYILIDILSNRTPIRVFMTYATFSPYNAYWRGLIFEYGIQNVLDNPIFGLGLNDWVRPQFMGISSVDNFWLLMGMRYGLPGFGFLALGFVIPLLHVGLKNLGDDTNLIQFRRAWMITFVGLTFTLSTVHIWATIYSFVFFLFGAGIFFTAVNPRQAGEAPSKEPVPDRQIRFRRIGLMPRTSQGSTDHEPGPPRPQSNSGTGKTPSTRDRANLDREQPRYSRFPKKPLKPN